MDPSLILARLRDAVRTVRREQDGTDEPMSERQLRNVLENMVDHVEALDYWLTTGGHLPEPWRVWEAQQPAP